MDPNARLVDGFGDSYMYDFERYSRSSTTSYTHSLNVDLTLIQGAATKGAVCLDGSLPAYHLHRGYGSGADNWIVDLEGGGWCSNIRECVYRKNSKHGSSNHMLKQINFTGVLSNNQEENPDFFNWNRVRVNYCDGASFTGDGEDTVNDLHFQGQRIWLAAMEELSFKGMGNAKQLLLTGCSAGGLAAILHCDEFRRLFPNATKVKCLSDAGMFLDAKDVSGGETLRKIFGDVVSIQGVSKNLPSTCTDHLDPVSCFFPQNLVANVKTPLFLLNAAYDAWQVKESLIPKWADPSGKWEACKSNHSSCTASQIQFFQHFRNQMLIAINQFSYSKQNGLFINSCFTHCQSELQDMWYSNNSPMIHNKGIAKSVGDWYFDRTRVKEIDCPYPCDGTCHHFM